MGHCRPVGYSRENGPISSGGKQGGLLVVMSRFSESHINWMSQMQNFDIHGLLRGNAEIANELHMGWVGYATRLSHSVLVDPRRPTASQAPN
jgi:hypothetical protein